MEPFTLSILLTREEYAADMARRARRVSWLTPTGLVLAVAALVLRLTVETFPLTAAWSILLLGGALLLCDYVFAPLLAQLNAAARYEQQPHLRECVTATFSEGAVAVESARYSGRLPAALCTDACETPTLFVFAFGAELTLRVPKRLLTDNQIAALRGWRH